MLMTNSPLVDFTHGCIMALQIMLTLMGVLLVEVEVIMDFYPLQAMTLNVVHGLVVVLALQIALNRYLS